MSASVTSYEINPDGSAVLTIKDPRKPYPCTHQVTIDYNRLQMFARTSRDHREQNLERTPSKLLDEAEFDQRVAASLKRLNLRADQNGYVRPQNQGT